MRDRSTIVMPESGPACGMPLFLLCVLATAVARPLPSATRLGYVARMGKVLEMPIASEQVGASRQGRRIDDGIRCCQLVPGAQLGSGKGDRSIQIRDNACLGERDHSIRFVLADLSS